MHYNHLALNLVTLGTTTWGGCVLYTYSSAPFHPRPEPSLVVGSGVPALVGRETLGPWAESPLGSDRGRNGPGWGRALYFGPLPRFRLAHPQTRLSSGSAPAQLRLSSGSAPAQLRLSSGSRLQHKARLLLACDRAASNESRCVDGADVGLMMFAMSPSWPPGIESKPKRINGNQ